MGIENRKSPLELRIYLMSLSGDLIWSNANTETTIDNESILLSAFISALFNFSREFITEDLQELSINEVILEIFPLYGEFLVVILMDKFTHQNNQQILQLLDENIQYLPLTNNMNQLNLDKDNLVPQIIAILTSFEKSLLDSITSFSENTAKYSMKFFSLTSQLIEKNLGIKISLQDGTQVFKYIPEQLNQTSIINDSSNLIKNCLNSLPNNKPFFLIQEKCMILLFNYKNLGISIFTSLSKEDTSFEKEKTRTLELKRVISNLIDET